MATKTFAVGDWVIDRDPAVAYEPRLYCVVEGKPAGPHRDLLGAYNGYNDIHPLTIAHLVMATALAKKLIGCVSHG